MRRHVLGILGLLLVAGGAITLWRGELAPEWSSAMLRIGLVFCALWLAFPQLVTLLKRFPPWLLATIAGGGMIVAARPRSIVFIGPVVLAIALVQFIGWLVQWFAKPPPPPRRKK